jgi:hypothetical protein
LEISAAEMMRCECFRKRQPAEDSVVPVPIARCLVTPAGSMEPVRMRAPANVTPGTESAGALS